MNALPRKAIIIGIQLLLISSFNHLFSQTDSIKTSYRQESADSSDYNYHRKYQYLDINLKDETNMFKLSIPTFTLSHTVQGQTGINSELLTLYITYEKKINPLWSVLLDESNTDELANSTNNFNSQFQFHSQLDIGIRYYYLLKDRIKKGTSGNNCNGLYTDFYVLNIWYYNYNYNELNGFNNIINNQLNYNLSPPVKLGFGLQKRLNNFSFFDTKMYIEYQPNSNKPGIFTFGLDFRIGFGWGWK